MYTSGTNDTKKCMKTALVYLTLSILCAIFGAVYELFSHGVFSFYMIYAFMVPLIFGTLPFFIMGILGAKRYPNAISRNLYHLGIITLTVGSIMRGALDIYGTTNHLLIYYAVIGVLMSVLGILSAFIKGIVTKSSK